MATVRVKKLVAIVGEKPDGKPVYRNMGSMFKNDQNGKFSLKIDAIPVGDWNGWVQIFELDTDQHQHQGQAQPSYTAPPLPTPAPEVPFSDDIPF